VLADYLQHVIVETHDEAARGLAFAKAQNAGRVGFVIASAPVVPLATEVPADVQVTPLSSLVRISGPAAVAIVNVCQHVFVAETAEMAYTAAQQTMLPIVTLEGDVYRGAQRIEGGVRGEARGILTTKREIKELRERIEQDQLQLARMREESGELDVAIAAAESAIASLTGELHRQEKAVVGFELQASGAVEASERVSRKHEQIAVERRSLEEEMRTQELRQDEARESIRRIEVEQRTADEQLSAAQRKLFEARDSVESQARRTAEAKAVHAALVERTGGLMTEVQRLEEAARELEARASDRRAELQRNAARREELQGAIAGSEAQLVENLRAFDALREQVRTADEASQVLKAQFEAQEGTIRDSRRSLEAVRAEVSRFDIERATAESDLSHLAAACTENVQATLDEVAAEVEQMERDGALASPQAVEDAPDSAEIEDEGSASAAQDTPPAPSARTLTPDEMVADLKAKIDRMGAVNMMAIDQFDDLESRHTFLTAQRKDLVDSIAATNEAIKKIDKTTRERFQDAFTVINQNFEGTFTTLFGGGRAGLVLLDESDALESGIDIIAQPPGKRLQSVQLLSGGEKALTAMALMFAIFKYRPSPFCLLDEIDAPLDDANIGRFVEMLQGMQEHTQFILITHNRKTMEIADRLYGVTMEEPGVSKLISVQLN
jgi:chromosome segregation protein